MAAINDDQRINISDTRQSLTSSTQAIHVDDDLNTTSDVAPPLHLSTTFRYVDNPEDLITATDSEVCRVFVALQGASRSTNEISYTIIAPYK